MGTSEVECPMRVPVPGFELELQVSACEDLDCTMSSATPLEAQPSGEEWVEASVRLELECMVSELRGADLTEGLAVILACELDPELPGAERLQITGTARPEGSGGGSLDVDLDEPLALVVESTHDGWELQPLRVSLTRAVDGQVVLMHRVVSEPPLAIGTRQICEEAAFCGGTRWVNEVGFGPDGAEVWVGEGQVADLDDSLRAWVAWSNGFRDESCGVYGGKSHTDLLVARVRR
jgi:hypothetical protein